MRGERLARVLNHYMGDVRIEDLDRKFAAVTCDLRTGYEVWLQQGLIVPAIAISLNGDAFGPIGSSHEIDLNEDNNTTDDTIDPFELAGQSLNKLRPDRLLLKSMVGNVSPGNSPKIGSVMMGTLNIVMDRISRSRLAGDPPDVFVAPRIGHIGMLEFTKADELIERGYHAMKREIPLIKSVMEVLAKMPSAAAADQQVKGEG